MQSTLFCLSFPEKNNMYKNSLFLFAIPISSVQNRNENLMSFVVIIPDTFHDSWMRIYSSCAFDVYNTHKSSGNDTDWDGNCNWMERSRRKSESALAISTEGITRCVKSVWTLLYVCFYSRGMREESGDFKNWIQISLLSTWRRWLWGNEKKSNLMNIFVD